MNNRCFMAADILLPDFEKTDARKWSVIACDQFTSEPEYWALVEAEVGDSPSTLNITLPEVYLDKADERIPTINATMEDYLSDVLKCKKGAEIFVERTQSDGSIRRGIVLAVDLESYDYRKGAKSLIRATEATVVERIPPRVAIRRNAKIELPHVMLLIDDPDKSVIEPLIDGCGGELAYDTELMLGGGHITGRYLSDSDMERVAKALDALIAPEKIGERYGDESLEPLLFAVGDGNHSLATAKALYEEIKANIGEIAAKDHPARYALVEIVNIHDEALKFEPIYRVLFGVDADDVIAELKAYVSGLDGSASRQDIAYLHKNGGGEIVVSTPVRQLPVATLQDFIDGYIAKNPSVTVDYIHGEDSVKALCSKDGTLGFIFSGMGKDELFKTVMFDGALPRKTFSMGHAEDKRYYLECRKITL